MKIISIFLILNDSQNNPDFQVTKISGYQKFSGYQCLVDFVYEVPSLN